MGFTFVPVVATWPDLNQEAGTELDAAYIKRKKKRVKISL